MILPTGERYYLDATLTDTNIRGTDVNKEGQFKGSGHDRRDTIEEGGGAAGGMLIGGLVGGPVGILIGGAIGAGSTTASLAGEAPLRHAAGRHQLTLELNRPLDDDSTPSPSGGSN